MGFLFLEMHIMALVMVLLPNVLSQESWGHTNTSISCR